MLLTMVLAPVLGASAEIIATSSVCAPGVKAGLTIVVFGVPEFFFTVMVIVGPPVPVETTRLTALPCGAVPGLVGVWLITLPAWTVSLAGVPPTPPARLGVV